MKHLERITEVRVAFLKKLVESLPGYGRAKLKGDLAAGLTTAVMLIPQAMAYAMLAGLPPVVGLYASIVPLVIYALFGSSRELAVGPVAMVSLLVATGVGALAPTGTEAFIAYAVLLAAMVGVIQLLMGVGRLGFLTNFLSHPVLSGFTSAAALIIGFSQLKHLLGVNIPRSHHVHSIVLNALGQIEAFHLVTLGIGVGSIVLLVALKRWRPAFPRALAVVVISTLVVWLFGFEQHGVKIVGNVPAGLPSPSLPGFDLAVMKGLIPTAITISLVGFMESIAVAKAFARRAKYEVNANQELIGLGAANIGGALFGAYPVTGGFSRTAVNAQAGAKTSFAAVITAAVIAFTLLLLTPLFYFLPNAVLAAIIMTAVFGLIDVKEVKHLWHVKKSDLVLLGTTFAATLILGIEEGILVGVGASMLWFVVRTTRPHFAVLGQLPGSRIYRNVERFPEAKPIHGVLAVRMDAQFYFGNMSFLRDTLKALEAKQKEPLSALVIDGSSINNLDSSADAALSEVAAEYAERGIRLYFAGLKGPVIDVMKRSGFFQTLGAESFFFEVADAVDAALGRQQDTARTSEARGRADLGDNGHGVLPTPEPAAG